MMHKQLGKLKQEINKKFGGLNIIFSDKMIWCRPRLGHTYLFGKGIGHLPTIYLLIPNNSE